VFRIYDIADKHEGAAGSDHTKFARDVDKIYKDPRAFWIDGGDSIDAVNRNDKRFNVQSVDPYYHNKLDDLADAQMDRYCERVEKIGDKCLGKLRGNHEESIRRYYHRDVTEKFCNRFRVPNLKNCALIRLRFRRSSPNMTTHPPTTIIKIFCAHGHITGRKTGSKLNRLKDLFTQFDADIYMIAHGHEKILDAKQTTLTIPNAGKLHLVTQIKRGFMTGSYLRTYQEGEENYAEKGLYAPSDLGAVCATIKPATKEVQIEETN
jgi:hypothetical protein